MPEKPTQYLTLMFVDIPSVTSIREKQGEQTAREFLEQCGALLGDIRKQFGGALIRAVGGTLLCSYEDADNAIRSACLMQKRVSEASLKGTSSPVVRMGLHGGKVTVRAGSCQGEVVTTTSRLVTLAKPRQIVATGEVFSKTSNELRSLFAPLSDASAMEERLRVRLFEVNWEAVDPSSLVPTVPAQTPEVKPLARISPEALERSKMRKTSPYDKPVVDRPPDQEAAEKRQEILTEVRKKVESTPGEAAPPPPVPKAAIAAAPAAGGSSGKKLCIIWQDQVMVVNEGSPSLRMGRADENDIVLAVNTASRRHAEVTLRNGVFVLTDRSGNGTFVYDETGQEKYVNRDEFVIEGSGAICPGCPQDEPGCEALLFWVAPA